MKNFVILFMLLSTATATFAANSSLRIEERNIKYELADNETNWSQIEEQAKQTYSTRLQSYSKEEIETLLAKFNLSSEGYVGFEIADNSCAVITPKAPFSTKGSYVHCSINFIFLDHN